jgi:signal transduction histidine kinase
LAEAAVRFALEKEKELSELKSRFWSMVVHEFRSPMTSILSSAQFLEHHGHQLPEERKREYLYLIQDSVRSMNQLLNDILSVTQAESGSLKFNPKPLNLEQFCRELVEEMQFSTGQNHRIIFSFQGNCTNTCLDKKLLWHVLTNLLSNAIKYSPQGGSIYLELLCPNGEITLKIRDTGIGIPIDDQDHLFKPFHRAENVGNIPGTGLGLTMVRKCLDLHGGQIGLESKVGVGTTFTIKLQSSNRVNQISNPVTNQ